ncbi:UBX domain-containing protein 6 [Apophysomyces sp. BC1034]|nr:UBX domain-containing protein 6 [Apophysomyces sp. BC1034]
MADSASVISETPNREVKVFAPPSNASSRVDLPESFYKLDANEIKALYSSQVERRQKLENAQVPLKTQKMRNAEEQERMKKYPKTAIRVRLPDSVILQATFQSKERVAELYEFVRSALRAPDRKFLLCLPPRSKLTDPTLTLFKAGLAPASNVIFVWIDKPENGQEGVYRTKERWTHTVDVFANHLS